MLYGGLIRFAIRSRGGSCSPFFGIVSHCKLSVTLHFVSEDRHQLKMHTRIREGAMIKPLHGELQPPRWLCRGIFITLYRSFKCKSTAALHSNSSVDPGLGAESTFFAQLNAAPGSSCSAGPLKLSWWSKSEDWNWLRTGKEEKKLFFWLIPSQDRGSEPHLCTD